MKLDDIQLLVKCLKMTKTIIQDLALENKIEVVANWENKIISELRSLQTSTIK